MENSVFVYDLSPLSDSLPSITPAMVLLNVFMQLANDVNEIRTTKNELATVLGKSRRTIAEWIIQLCKSGAIKYKYKGIVCVNPLVYYKGTAQNYKNARNNWEEFKSDIKAQR